MMRSIDCHKTNNSYNWTKFVYGRRDYTRRCPNRQKWSPKDTPISFLRPLLFAGLDIHEIQVRQLLKSYLCRTVGHFCGNAVSINSFEFYRLEINTTWCSLYGPKFTDKKFENVDKKLYLCVKTQWNTIFYRQLCVKSNKTPKLIIF